MLARRNLFNELMRDPFDFRFFGSDPLPKEASSLMRTDVRETPEAYILEIDLPGFKKENVEIELSQGYLSVSAHTEHKSEETKEDGTFLHKERFSGTCRRSFYVGDDILENDINAKFENGILKITVYKKELPKPEDSKRLISIED